MRELKDEWVKPFDNEQKLSLRKIGNVEFGYIENKDDHCYKHKIDYNNECHKLPSKKIIWLGCPICYSDDQKVARRRHFIMFMKDAGMRHNDDKDEWFKPELPGEKKEEYIPFAKRRVV